MLEKYYYTYVLYFVFTYVSFHTMCTTWETRSKQFGATRVDFTASKVDVHVYTFVLWVSKMFTNSDQRYRIFFISPEKIKICTFLGKIE